MVLPDPGPPTRSVVRPRGSPPPVISSKPAIPVAAFRVILAAWRSDFINLLPFRRNAPRTPAHRQPGIDMAVRGPRDYALPRAAVCALTYIRARHAKIWMERPRGDARYP